MGAIGAAMDCYDTALRYAKERISLENQLEEHNYSKKTSRNDYRNHKSAIINLAFRSFKKRRKATTAQISMAKRNNVNMAIQIAREARQMLGGMGITGEYSIMRHMMNLESVITYEGTHDIHLLITGMDVTGISAFK
jgi:glutaryl-CoA dehydrogenase